MMETDVPPNSNEPEEGEIENEEDEIYIPLERPHVASSTLTNVNEPVSDNEDQLLDDSSSDSDSKVNRSSFAKLKKKLPMKPVPSLSAPPKKKNYNIWCFNDLQTEVLTDTLVNCNVDQSKERERDVETYDYKLALSERDPFHKRGQRNKYPEVEVPKRAGAFSKRKHDGQYVSTTNTKSDPFIKKEGVTGPARTILGLSKTVNDSLKDIAKDIANKLCEEKEDIIFNALKVVGKEPIITLFEETREVEKNGGMLIMNGMRRRTPGGVFFYLLKTSMSISQEQITAVFLDNKRTIAQEKKKTAREMRRQRTAKLKEAISKDDFPTLLSHTELAIKHFKARKEKEEAKGLTVEETEVKNPPPSPATDGKDNSSDGEDKEPPAPSVDASARSLTSYADDPFSEDLMDLA